MVTVRIPSQMRALVGGASTVEAEGTTVAEVLESLRSQHAELAERVFDDDGKVRRFINVFLDDEDIRFLGGAGASVTSGQTVSLLPAVAGG